MRTYDENHCENFYGEEPFHEENILEWILPDGSTGPAGEAFLASLGPEDFV